MAASTGTRRADERLRADRALLERYARHPTPALRDRIVTRFMPLARRIAARYAHTTEPFDDVLQVAALGLVKAVDRYDVTRGIAFSSYAVPTIAGEIKRYFRDLTWLLRLPRDLQEMSALVDSTRVELEERLGRVPTVSDIAEALGLADEEVLEAMLASEAHRVASLDAPLDDGGGEDDLYERIGVEDLGVRHAEARATLDPLLPTLPPRSRLVVRLRFEADLNQREIGEIVGLSRMQVSRILRASIATLRETAGHGGSEDAATFRRHPRSRSAPSRR